MPWGSFQIQIIEAKLVPVVMKWTKSREKFVPEDILKTFAKVNRPTDQSASDPLTARRLSTYDRSKVIGNRPDRPI